MKTVSELFSDPYMAAGLTCCLIGYLTAGILIWRTR